MKLADIKDSNGTALQAFVDLLAEKCSEAGLIFAFIARSKDPKDKDLVVKTNAAPSTLPHFLIAVGQEMKDEESGPSPVSSSN
jgi:hypothetical protein